MDDLTLALAAAQARRLWLKAVLDRFPFLIDLPRYLSLSVLRI
jgi:hypothetical protein